MKKPLLVLSLLSFTLLHSSPVLAEDRRGLKTSVRAERKELRTEIKERIQNFREDIKHKVGGLRAKMAKVVSGEITAISGSTLTVSKEGKTYTVNTDSNTHFQRHYWGKSTLDEFSVGDRVNIHGKFTDEAMTTILAKLVRNLSIMKRHGVLLGDVTVKNSDNFVISTKNRGDQTVYFDDSSKFVKRNNETMTYADLQVGHRVRVKGVWDKTLNQVTETNQVKDYNLPPKAVKTGSPTSAATSTVTPTSTLTLTPTPTP